MVNNGDKVRHKITGIEGVVVGHTNWLYGCKRVHIQLIETKDGRPQDLLAVDEPELEVIHAGFLSPIVNEPKQVRKSTGGPRDYMVKKEK